MKNGITTFSPSSLDAWRNWLKANHSSESAVWLIFYKVASGIPSLSWSEAVDEALCFGWIDGIKKTVDEQRFKQLYTPRKPKSTWSKINKEKVKHLINEGLMTPAGIKCIEVAKSNGSWNALDDVEALIVPEDLKSALEKQPGAMAYFDGLSKSSKKIILHWVTFAKRAETRAKRIAEAAESAARKEKPKQFQ